MVKIPSNMHTTQFMLDTLPDIQETRRPYLGMSSLASDCTRKIWYGFRFATKKVIPAKVMRIFKRGDWEEHRIIKDLKEIGIEVYRLENGEKIEIFGMHGEKQEEIIGFAEHAKGHIDGRCIGVIEAPKTEHLLEMKTMNSARFKKFCDKGVQESDPVYYGQAQRYMDGIGATRALFISTNKDNEDRQVERIRIDKEYVADLKRREQDIIMSDSPNLWEKFSRSWYACKGCAAYDVCQNEAEPVRSCRNCEHVDLAMEGKWVCGLNNDRELSLEEQISLSACNGKSYRRLF